MAGILAPTNSTARFLYERCEENVRIHAAESFSRNSQFLIYPVNSWNYVYLEGSLSCPQHSVSCPCPEPDQSSESAHVLFKNHFNIIVSHLCLGLPVASFPQFPHQNTFCISFLPLVCYLPIPS